MYGGVRFVCDTDCLQTRVLLNITSDSACAMKIGLRYIRNTESFTVVKIFLF